MNNKLTIKQPIRGLEMALEDDAIQEVSTKQIIEKLRMIRTETMNTMCFHPDIVEKLEGERQWQFKRDVQEIYINDSLPSKNCTLNKSLPTILNFRLLKENYHDDQPSTKFKKRAQYFTVNIPRSAKILDVTSLRDDDVFNNLSALDISLSVLVRTDEKRKKRKIYILGMGSTMSGFEGAYIGFAGGWYFFDE